MAPRRHRARGWRFRKEERKISRNRADVKQGFENQTGKKFVPSFQEIKGNGKMGLRKVSLATA